MIALFLLISVTIATQAWLQAIFEFFLFKGEYKTHRFKERIYPKKYSSFKRFFLITYFDKELMEKCKYKKKMKTVVISDIIYLICSLVFIIRRIYDLLISGESSDYFNVPEIIFLSSSCIFYIWFKIKSTRWSEWIRGNWHAGQFEFQIHLPDEKKKKK